MKFWEQIQWIWFDRRLNKHLGTGQFTFQDPWALWFQRWIEREEEREHG